MLNVKREDFEVYRKRLFNYAVALLKSKGSAHTLYSEYENKAKDIVQECYLAFHDSDLNIFVNEFHLFSYLKICLYHKYQESVSSKRRYVQYNLFKEGNIDYLEDKKESFIPLNNINENDDYIKEFLNSLLPRQKELVNKLLDGWKPYEIAKELGVSQQALSESMKYIKIKYNNYENSNS